MNFTILETLIAYAYLYRWNSFGEQFDGLDYDIIDYDPYQLKYTLLYGEHHLLKSVIMKFYKVTDQEYLSAFFGLINKISNTNYSYIYFDFVLILEIITDDTETEWLEK